MVTNFYPVKFKHREDKRLKSRISAGMVPLLALILFVPQAGAQSKIGFVDSQKILSTYPAAQDANKKLEEENTQWASELQKLDNELKVKEDELEVQSLILSDAKRKEKQDEIKLLKENILKFQNQKWGESGEYFKRQEELLRPVFDRIHQVIAAIADDDGYDFILDTVQGNILYSKEKFDLTDEVLRELEKDAPAKK